LIRAAALALTAALFGAAGAKAASPQLVKHGTATQLVVGGRPMLLIAGELGNSSASSAAFMAPHWARLKAMHLNTVVAPVSWELIEPDAGRFDWSSVDDLIAQARAHDLKLVLLWFGAWKNSMSTYPPSWVKRDQARFPRAQLADGQGVEILSAFSPAVLDADSRAYAALLAHLKAVDGDKNTVVMVQVENEIGMLPVARDHSAAANAAFKAPVPKALVRYLVEHRATLEPELKALWETNGAKTTGDWTALFGKGDAAEEVLTAWHYARFADRLAAAGKAAYPLPMYVNAALNRPGRTPGQYPSGGPVPHLIDVWKAAAPHLDFLAPDVYFPNFMELARRYKRADNAFYTPEAGYASWPAVPANAFFAFGELDAIGFGPFDVETLDKADPPSPVARASAVLEQLAPAILEAQGTGKMAGFEPRVAYDGAVDATPVTKRIGDYEFNVAFMDDPSAKPTPETASHGGLIIQTGPEDYLVAGQGLVVKVKPATDGPPLAGLDRVEEGVFDAGGRWIAGRRLNGDQTIEGREIRLGPGEFQIQKARLYRYR
jgi:beta-galactosidase GanA